MKEEWFYYRKRELQKTSSVKHKLKQREKKKKQNEKD
jgi:hypothetical protein